MDTYKLKFTKLQNEIFRLFCIKAGESLNHRGIARLLEVSPTAVAKALPLLEKEKLLVSNKMREFNFVSVKFNRENQGAIEMKRVENLRFIYEKRLNSYMEECFPGCTIILFGSYAHGEDTIDSDIDLAVIGSKPKNVKFSKFEKVLERKINLNFYSALKDIDTELKENILNGITLAGGIEL